jgi:hypothetical protein
MFASNEFISGERSKPVPVQVDGCRVHRDELRNVRVVPLPAVDDVSGPEIKNEILIKFKSHCIKNRWLQAALAIPSFVFDYPRLLY